jgi:hypothetical protein
MRMQPALIYSALGLATLLRSSDAELGASGRERAVWLRNVASSLIESAWNTRWLDERLAQAALVSILSFLNVSSTQVAYL